MQLLFEDQLPDIGSIKDILEDANNQTYSLSEVFDFFVGIQEDLYDISKESNICQVNGEVRVFDARVLNLALDTEDKLLPEERLNAYFEELDIKKSKKVKKKLKVNKLRDEIKPTQFLKKEDFVIFTKGYPRGLSMWNFLDQLKIKLVPNNQFIIARPKIFGDPNNFDLPIRYAHKCILEPLVHFGLQDIYKEKKKDKPSSSFNTITIKELNDFKVRIPGTSDKMQKVLKEVADAENELESRLKILEGIKSSVRFFSIIRETKKIKKNVINTRK